MSDIGSPYGEIQPPQILADAVFEGRATEAQRAAFDRWRRDTPLVELAGVVRESAIDVTTGLPNRRGAELQFDPIIQLIRRAAHPSRARPSVSASLTSLDIEDLHGHNNAHGEEETDGILFKPLASELDKHRRGTDIVARTGGDEFTIVAVSDIPIREVTHRNVAQDHMRQVIAGVLAQSPQLRRLGIVSKTVGVVPEDSFSSARLRAAQKLGIPTGTRVGASMDYLLPEHSVRQRVTLDDDVPTLVVRDRETTTQVGFVNSRVMLETLGQPGFTVAPYGGMNSQLRQQGVTYVQGYSTRQYPIT